MKILLSGSKGLVGSALIPFLTTGGHSVVRLVRKRPQENSSEVFWNPDSNEIETARLEGQDAVVHLAGENIGKGRWTNARKARIRNSRVSGTKLLSEALARLSHPPQVLISSSAIGFYGNRGHEILTEESQPGTGFLSDVCREWEAATEPARRKGIRVVHLRTGVVLSPRGGALKKMLMPFRLGVGGKIGKGSQDMSWISIDDLISIILFALFNKSLQGAVNAVAPEPVSNQEFTRVLGHVLSRPTLFPLPAFIVHLLFGEMGDQLLLASTRVQPHKLLSAGFSFRHSNLESALRHLLGKVE